MMNDVLPHFVLLLVVPLALPDLSGLEFPLFFGYLVVYLLHLFWCLPS